MLTRLWRLRLLVALGVLLAALLALLVTQDVSLSPPSVKAKRSVFGAAQTQVFVDSDRPSLVTGEKETAALAARAQVVARFVGSGAIRSQLAGEMGVDAREISVTGPFPDTPGAQNSQPVAQQRADALLSEGSALSIFIDTEANAPVITFFIQGRTGQEAMRLARATTAALRDYVRRQRDDAEPTERARLERQFAVEEEAGRTVGREERRLRTEELLQGATVVRTLGAPVGGEVGDQSGRLITVAVFAVLALAWCVALLLISGLRDAARRR